MNITKRIVLDKFGVTEADFVARGMEAEVYRYGDTAVLKLYNATTSFSSLRHLQDFYTSLQRSNLSYALPYILHVSDENSHLVTIEQRLNGQLLTERIQTTPPHQLDSLFAFYVDAVLELATISMPPATTAYKLFDPHKVSNCTQGDWHRFLHSWVTFQLQTLTPHFEHDVYNFQAKLNTMLMLLDTPYYGSYKLIHGDIFPGNIFVAPDGKPLALLDFGLFTMYGDPLFDAATAWVFFDMYDELQANVRSRLLPFFLARLGSKVIGRLFRYVLLYSFLSANTYASDCSDGHYAWCIANLNTSTYWEDIE